MLVERGLQVMNVEVVGDAYAIASNYLRRTGAIADTFATNEPFIYENALPDWKKPVKFQLIHDTGYPIYPEAIVVRADKKAEHAACLRKLVPIIQRSQIDFVQNPAATNELITKLDGAYKGYGYPAAQAAFSVEQQLKLNIVGNGANGTLGDFDLARITQVIGIVGPIYSGQRKEIKSGLTADDLVTNEFIDPTIGLK